MYDFIFIFMDFNSPFNEMKIMKFTASRPVDLLEEFAWGGGGPMENKTRSFCDIKDLAFFSKLAKLLQSRPVKQIFPDFTFFLWSEQPQIIILKHRDDREYNAIFIIVLHEKYL
jgi:hypothetical protein